MTVEEIIEKCKKQQELQGSADAMMVFVLPGGARTEKRRLFGRRGPLGQVVGTSETTSQVAFKADEILAWLAQAVTR